MVNSARIQKILNKRYDIYNENTFVVSRGEVENGQLYWDEDLEQWTLKEETNNIDFLGTRWTINSSGNFIPTMASGYLGSSVQAVSNTFTASGILTP